MEIYVKEYNPFALLYYFKLNSSLEYILQINIHFFFYLLMHTQIYTQINVLFMKAIYPKLHCIQYESLHPKITNVSPKKGKQYQNTLKIVDTQCIPLNYLIKSWEEFKIDSITI